MKAKNLFFGALACLAFAACSNEDEPTLNGGWANGEGQYISVNIVTPAETRATAGDYLIGTGKESTINDVVLVFFSGETFLTAKTASTSDLNQTSTAPQIEEKLLTATAYLVPDDFNNVQPNRVVAILNGATFTGGADNYTLTEGALNANKPTFSTLQESIKDYMGTVTTNVPDNFLMTNSVWSESEGYTSISSANFRTSIELAKAAPVDIYVERVLAKVNVKYSVDEDNNVAFTNSGTLLELTNGTSTQVYPKIIGCHLARTANTSYLIKSLGDYSSWTWNWDDKANKRSYWAEAPTTQSYSYNKYSVNQAIPVEAGKQISFYCQENTDKDNRTELVVLAQLQDGSGNDIESFVGFGGLYYTPTDYLKSIASVLDGAYKFTGSGTWDWTEKLKIVKKNTVVSDAKQWLIVAQLNVDELENIAENKDGGATVTADAVNTFLQGESYTAMMWGTGRCYYHVKIEHFGLKGEGNSDYGVVRNHAYELSLSSVVGLGTPVYDPDNNWKDEDDDEDDDEEPEPEEEEEIIPDDPEDGKSYVAARINVLKWKVVKQNNVQLGQ